MEPSFREAHRPLNSVGGSLLHRPPDTPAIRHQLGLQPYERLPAREALSHHTALVVRPADIPGLSADDLAQLTQKDSSAWSAITALYDHVVIVIVNDTHSEARQESNMHHEAAHLVCGHMPRELTTIGDLTLRTYDPVAEEEANWLAGCLHLPRPALLRAIRYGHDSQSIATIYKASSQMVAYRRSVTGVDRQLRR